MDLSFTCNNPLTAEPFVIQRSNGGAWGPGGWNDKYTNLNYYGNVTIADPKVVDAQPDADHIHGAITINCELPIYVTREQDTNGNPATSDLLMYHGELYRIVAVRDYSSRGYWWGLAARILGA
jgi:hypothetical protein